MSEVIVIEDLPDYWKMIIRGGNWRVARCKTSTCPYDGGNLIASEEPEIEYSCKKCGRKYV